MGSLYWKKALFAVPLLGLFLVICYLGGWFLLIPLILVAVIGLGEYYTATFRKGHRPAVALGFVAGTMILLVTEFIRGTSTAQLANTTLGPDAMLLPLDSGMREGALLAVIIFLVGFTLLTQFGNGPEQSAVSNTAITCFGVIYIPLMLSFMLRLRQCDLPAALHYDGVREEWHRMGALLLVLIPVWVCDTMAQTVGRVWGSRKLAPTISPGKTVEGAAAGFVAAVIVTLALGTWLGMPWFHALALGCLIGVVGQLGDLGKSVLKRDLGIKDFGNLFGPHGGVLDRLDAPMFTMPLAYLYLWLFFFPH
jgi:phosphatidate cytidylyltransferase